ncbi:AraC family transcriptional regulator [Pseudonocardia sp.]|uniref:AraC family transcriptional regulator n=1 Tax=Pseudonocardia sp. TaxID=60912 RepID=UPI002638BE24|nr:AraC family transcriptional regulator [Pseudonocardia sp.]
MDAPWLAAPPDPLAEALHHLRMSGVFYCHSELTAPWGLTMPAMPGCLWFHAVTAGECLLEFDGTEPLVLRAGDVAVVPHGGGHRGLSEPGAITPNVLDLPHQFTGDRYAVLRHGSGGALTSMLCGAVQFDSPAARAVVAQLPPTLHLTASPRTEAMQATMGLIAAEARDLRPGGEAILTRLSDVLVVQAVRSWLETDPVARTGWLGALHDPQIGRAVAAVHRDPARAWTVAALAAEVPMSRSAFAARFTALVGEPALAYVTRWRMHLALDRLRADDPLSEVAGRLGYRSEAAFSRAFKRVTGTSPGAARRTVRTPTP